MENNKNRSIANREDQPMTPALDLMAPSERFVATSRLYVRLHRQQLMLRRYWWVLVLVALTTIVPAFLLTKAAPRAFKSDARMWLTGKLDLSEGRLYTEELVNF